jgi:hypothetical protein
MCDDGKEFVIFCFFKPEDAEAFGERFGGDEVADEPVTLKTSGRPERVFWPNC